MLIADSHNLKMERATVFYNYKTSALPATIANCSHKMAIMEKMDGNKQGAA